MVLLAAVIYGIGYILYGLATVAVWVFVGCVIVIATILRSLGAFCGWLWERYGVR